MIGYFDNWVWFWIGLEIILIIGCDFGLEIIDTSSFEKRERKMKNPSLSKLSFTSSVTRKFLENGASEDICNQYQISDIDARYLTDIIFNWYDIQLIWYWSLQYIASGWRYLFFSTNTSPFSWPVLNFLCHLWLFHHNHVQLMGTNQNCLLLLSCCTLFITVHQIYLSLE